jgi:hypothetical protein
VKDTLSRIELPPGATLEESYSNTENRPTRSPIPLAIYKRSGEDGKEKLLTTLAGLNLMLEQGELDNRRFSLSGDSLTYTPFVNEDLDFEGTLPNTKQKKQTMPILYAILARFMSEKKILTWIFFKIYREF